MPRRTVRTRWRMAVADPGGEIVLAGYRMLGNLVRPVVPAILRRRAGEGKEDPKRSGERYGIASVARPAGDLVWVHAASVGETNAVMPLVRRLASTGITVLFTTTTVTSAGIAASALPEGAIHQYGPLDIGAYVTRFLDHWRPRLVIFVESEVWPAILSRLAAQDVPLVIVNARMSDRSLRGWRRFGFAARAIFSRITACLAQSEEDGNRFRSLGAKQVVVTGNIKFDTPDLPARNELLAALQADIGQRPVWVAASTHEGEEEAVADVHHRLTEWRPDVLTISVPRHPVRGDAIRALFEARGLRVAQRSRGEPLTADTAVYLADTLGELGLFYRAAPVTFLGGSLAEVGGHNPIEPVRLGAAVVHGPHVGNFTELFGILDRIAPATVVADPGTLGEAVLMLLKTPDEARRIATDSAAAFAPLSGALDATMNALEPYLARK